LCSFTHRGSLPDLRTAVRWNAPLVTQAIDSPLIAADMDDPDQTAWTSLERDSLLS